MADGVKGCCEVEEEVVGDFEECCFCAVTWAETGLKWFERVIGGEVGVELCGDSTFQYFRQKGEVGDGPEVAHGVRLECRFFEDGVTAASLRV